MIRIYQYICDVCQKQLYSYSAENTLKRASNHYEELHKDKISISTGHIKEVDPSIFLNTKQYTPVSVYVPNTSNAGSDIVYLRMTDNVTDSNNNLITIYSFARNL